MFGVGPWEISFIFVSFVCSCAKPRALVSMCVVSLAT
jgi:hypothetical protein